MTLGTNVPTPAYTNPTIQPQFFAPDYFQISAVAKGKTTQVTVLSTFGVECNFVVGQQVLFVIPNRFGTIQLNNMTGIVTSIVSPNVFTLNIDSSAFSDFIATPDRERQIAQVLPAGTFRTGNINPNPSDVGLTIPGSFTNTSPFVG
jgi:hypothetical protein